MDRVALRGLKARGHHGVFPKEREDGQTFLVDIVLGLDTRPAAADDDLAKTVHYGIVAEEVVAVVDLGKPGDPRADRPWTTRRRVKRLPV
ncbi:hypothetical protein STENM327S_05093 [Streptomyces tendae]